MFLVSIILFERDLIVVLYFWSKFFFIILKINDRELFGYFIVKELNSLINFFDEILCNVDFSIVFLKNKIVIVIF